MRVVKQYQDFSDEDGFPNVFIMDDNSIVLASEKRSVHLKEDRELLESTYKRGLTDLKVQRALEEIEVQAVDFDPAIRLLYNLVMGD